MEFLRTLLILILLLIIGKMNKTKSIAVSLVVVALVLIAAGWWFFRSLDLSQKSEEQSDLILLNKVKTSATQNITDFLTADNEQKSIAKDLFVSEQFLELKDTPVEINTSNIGNSRPFAPLTYTFENP